MIGRQLADLAGSSWTSCQGRMAAGAGSANLLAAQSCVGAVMMLCAALRVTVDDDSCELRFPCPSKGDYLSWSDVEGWSVAVLSPTFPATQ